MLPVIPGTAGSIVTPRREKMRNIGFWHDKFQSRRERERERERSGVGLGVVNCGDVATEKNCQKSDLTKPAS